MATGPGLALAAGGITAANELFFAPVTGSGALANFNWRILPATAILAVMLSGLEQISPELAKGIGVTVLVTVLFAPVGKAPAPAVNLDKLLGYKNKAGG